MENAIHSLTLDLTGPDIRPVVEVRKDNARTLVIALTQGGRPYWIAEGVTAVFSARNPDGNPLFNACTIEKNRVRYDFTAQTTNVAGIVECEILLYSGDEKILSSPKFELLVDDIIHQEGDVPESAPEISALTQMVAAGTAMLEDLREALEGLEGVEEILTQARVAAEAASNSEAAAEGHARTAADAAADALGYAEDAEAQAKAAKRSEDNSRINLQEAETAARRAEEAAANAGQGGGSDSGQNLSLDTTLTQGGKAADSKAVGDALDELEEKIPTKPKDIGAQPQGNYASPEDIPKVPSWAMQASKPAYAASEVGADPKGTAAAAVSAHNANNEAHNDIRQELAAINARLTAFFNSDNQTLDELSEIVAYITSNKSLIDAITTSKVSVADIVNNLTTNVANKPLSAAQGVALKTLIDGLASGKLDASKLTEAINTALAQAKSNGDFDGPKGDPGTAATFEITGATALAYGAAPTISEQSDSTPQARKYKLGIPAGKPGADGYTPKRGKDYWTPDDIAAMDAKLAQMLAERAQLRPEPAESLEWLKANGDTSKLYVLTDKSSAHYGYIYGYILTEVESGPAYTNVLSTAVGTDGQPFGNGKGYLTGYRFNSSTVLKESEGNCTTGLIACKQKDVIRAKNVKKSASGNGYVHFWTSTYTNAQNPYYEMSNDVVVGDDGIMQFSIPDNSGIAFFSLTIGVIDDTSIITINEEIVEGGGTTTEYAWASIAFVSTDYGPRVTALERQTAQNAADIANLKKGVGSAAAIADWDAPIYDANVPVFQLSTEKAAMTNATNTPANIYAKYDALMAKHPKYITKTDLGLCSDGVNHVYRYDFREPAPHYESGKVWSETKAKAILMTGVHFEWAGIYSLYYALEEIADNPELRNFRRNTHLIVVPVANPYATIASNYQSGLDTPNSYGVRNARGVEIHRNFEVDWILNDSASAHYGGPAPLSEVETKYIDNILKNNTDAAVFLSCHNCGVESIWGTGFIWSSTATKYTCNMGNRLVDKMSYAWMDKYGDVLSAGIEEYKTDALADGDTRLGWAGLSTSPGTEAKQATKYGIQGTNIEICDPFQIHGTKADPEPSMSAFTVSRGAEVYVNFLLTAFGVYDPKDKKEYAPATV